MLGEVGVGKTATDAETHGNHPGSYPPWAKAMISTNKAQ